MHNMTAVFFSPSYLPTIKGHFSSCLKRFHPARPHHHPSFVSPQILMSHSQEIPSGPYPVAVCDVRMPDSEKPSFRLRLFYPTVADTNTSPALFFPPSAATIGDWSVRSVLRFANIPLSFLLSLPLSYIASLPLPAQAVGNLPVCSHQKFPLMLFSHGLGGGVGNYSNFCIDMASHGWVVAAPEHADGSAFEARVDAEQTPIPYHRVNSNLTIPEARASQLDKRCQELSSLFDVLADDPAKTLIPLRAECPVPQALSTSIDTTRFVIAGHSFGGATALLYTTYHARERCPPVAALCLDAWLVPLNGPMHEVHLPYTTDVLFIDMDESNMKQSIALRGQLERESSNHVEGNGERGIVDAVAVINGMHNNSSDFPLRIPKWIALAVKMTKKDSDPLALLQTQNKAAVKFLAGHDSWRVFREDIESKREDGLRIAFIE